VPTEYALVSVDALRRAAESHLSSKSAPTAVASTGRAHMMATPKSSHGGGGRLFWRRAGGRAAAEEDTSPAVAIVEDKRKHKTSVTNKNKAMLRASYSESKDGNLPLTLDEMTSRVVAPWLGAEIPPALHTNGACT
jgi:hypothetical protein